MRRDGKVIEEMARQSVLFHARTELRQGDPAVEDIIQDVISRVLKRPPAGPGAIEHLRTYIDKIALREVSSYRKALAKERTGIAGIPAGDPCEDASPEEGFDEQEAWASLERAIEYVGLLYFLKSNLEAAERFVFPYVRSLNALKEAREKVDSFGRPLPAKAMISLWNRYARDLQSSAARPIDFVDEVRRDPRNAMRLLHVHSGAGPSHPEDLRHWCLGLSFYEDIGRSVSDKLTNQISELEREMAAHLAGPGTSPADFYSKHLHKVTELEGWILDAIPRLRAAPAMLLLRILYRVLRIGSGRYGARRIVNENILRLSEKYTGTYLADVFTGITATTNFETLRKKLYQKKANGLYDRLAEYICAKSFPLQRST